MSKVQVKIVIGANYGDEGKGLATRFFSINSDKPCLNVLFNGGCQRGHTVDLKNGKRHVFHHFGSGSFDGTDTFFDRDFILNPIVFVQELFELQSNKVNPRCFASELCRVSTPYDAFINQIVENSRGGTRHGSCGFGIWETQKRYECSKYAKSFNELSQMTDEQLKNYLDDIRTNYLPYRLSYYGVEKIPVEYISLINSDGLIYHYISDFRVMTSCVKRTQFKEIREQYKTIVFEGAQGLALDENNKKALPYITASDTTSLVPIQRVLDLDCDIEVCYISRSYFTRHGAGIFPSECSKEDISKDIIDITNVPNEFQGTIRYGKFESREFFARVVPDFERAKVMLPRIRTSLLVTHLNYTKDISGNTKLSELQEFFDNIYKSKTKYAEDII